MFPLNQKTLKNGVRLTMSQMKETKAVTLLILVGIGSRFEQDKIAGISHFLEHMFFKGTKNRPTYKEITQELDYLGGDYNAYTGEEYTGYYVQAAADKFPKALDILSDMFFNSTFPESEIAREQGVIIEEINMYEDQPMAKVAQESSILTYGKTDLGRPIIGSKETVRGITKKDLITYHNNMYQPSNTIVSVAGASLSFDWEKEIAKVFESWGQRQKPKHSTWDYAQKKPQINLTNRQTDQAHFVLSYPLFGITDKKRPIARVMANMLGGMMSSRLFEEIREKRGLAYYVRAGLDEHTDAGAFNVSAGVVVAKINDAIRVTLEQLDLISKIGPDAEELKRAQENIKGAIYLGLEDSQSVAQYMANRLLYFGTIEQPEKIVEAIEKVTSDQIKSLAKELFNQNKRNLAVIGPFKDKTVFEKLVG